MNIFGIWEGKSPFKLLSSQQKNSKKQIIMKIKHLFFSILSAIILLTSLFACKQNNSKKAQLTNNDSPENKPIHMDTFSVSPEMNDCSCFFATDSAANQEGAYILAYDLATTAFMKINGVIIKFNQTEYSVVGDGSITKFKSEDYELLLETGDVRELDPSSTLQSGSIRVTHKDGTVAVTPFYGWCGCKYLYRQT
jgi:hypothetical protein